MSSKSKQQLKLDNQTNFPNNNNGFITPDKLRNFHIDLIDSTPVKSDIDLIQSEIDSLESSISAEITRAINAENSLSTAIEQSGGDLIQQEILDRISGDISLTNAINTEITDRIEKDIELGGEVSRIQELLVGEVESRILEDGTLSTAISTETSNRISADTSLSTSLSTETFERLSADTSITNLISNDYVPYTGSNKDVDLGDHTLATDGIKLDIFTPYIVQNPGEIGWNSVEGTLDLRLYNATTLQLGQEIHTYGRAVGKILNGEPVQFAGVQGNHILIKTANGIEIEQNPYLFIGIATQNINNGKFGYVTYFGKVNGIYTEDWVSGDEIYLNTLFNGLTNVKPNVPNRVIKVGYLIKSQTGQAENGVLSVKISYGTKLTDLEDVNGTIPTEGDIPVYQSGNYFDFTHNINDYALQTTLSTEISERQTADSSLTTLISSESSQRISADSSLTALISTEILQRISEDSSLTTRISTEEVNRVNADLSLSTELATTTAIAKGAQQAIVFNTYGDMVTYLMGVDYADLNLGQSIYINTLNVPDIWISGVPITPVLYVYISDEQLINDVNSGGGQLQIGYATISFLETQKVDLTNYVTTNALSTAISSEASARISGDVSVTNILNSSISTEASNRLSGELSLTTRISTEEVNRVNSDLSLSTAISTEASTRLSGDSSLTTRISTEEVIRVSSDSSLTTRISAEESARLLGDASLSNAIANITVTGELANLTDVDVTSKINDDLLRFDAATGKWVNETPVDILESVNSGELLMNVFGVIQGVTPESIVSNVDTSLTTRISTEEVNRVNGDSSLSTAISTEASTRLSGDSSLTTRISTEEVNRVNGDSSLSTAISTEASTRLSGDSSLTTRISTEEVNRVNGDSSLASELATTTAIAKGAQQALSFQNYWLMVNYFNNWIEEPIDETTKVGQSIFINTLDVPDIWISGTIFPSHIPTQYNYISDQKLIDDVNANGGYLQMGFYYISFLETEKVDLTNYVTGVQLSTAISTEESIRLSADQSLSSALSTSNSQRISVDISLSTAITSKIGNNTDTYTGTAAAEYIITLTQAEYDAIGTKNANTLYVII